MELKLAPFCSSWDALSDGIITPLSCPPLDGLSEEMLAWRELRALRQRVAELEQQLDIGEKQKKKGLHFTVRQEKDASGNGL